MTGGSLLLASVLILAFLSLIASVARKLWRKGQQSRADQLLDQILIGRK